MIYKLSIEEKEIFECKLINDYYFQKATFQEKKDLKED